MLGIINFLKKIKKKKYWDIILKNFIIIKDMKADHLSKIYLVEPFKM